jgi:hypothetical protein
MAVGQRRRKWRRLSLCILFVLPILIGLVGGYVYPSLNKAWRRHETSQQITRLGGQVLFDGEVESIASVFQGAFSGGPKSIGVHLEGQRFDNETITALDQFAALDGVCLSDTKVSDPGLRHITRPGLRGLFLTGGKFSDGGLRQNMGELAELETLGIMWMPIDGSGLSFARKSTGLRNLRLCMTRTDDAALDCVRDFKELRELDLFHTSVTDAGLAKLIGLKHLRDLSLGETRVTDSGLSNLCGLVELHRLFLGGTTIRGPGLGSLTGLRSIETLNLSRTGIDDDGTQYLVQMRSLRHLSLSGTKITDVSLARLRHLDHLESLVLSNTKVTSAGLKYLAHLPNLRDLDLIGCDRITDEAVKSFQKSLPRYCYVWRASTKGKTAQTGRDK